MEEEFDLSEAVSGATKAQADREFYLAMATQGKAVSPIAAYLAGAAGAKASTLQGKIQADKDAKTAAEKFTTRRDKLLLNMHAIGRDKNTNPATKAGMIGLIAKEIGLTPKNYDAENNVLDVADANGDMFTFDFNEYLGDKAQAEINKINAQTKTEGAKKAYYENKKSSSGSSEKPITLTDINKVKIFKDAINNASGTDTSIQDSLNEDLREDEQQALLNMLEKGDNKVKKALEPIYKTLEKKFNNLNLVERPPQSVQTSEETYSF